MNFHKPGLSVLGASSNLLVDAVCTYSSRDVSIVSPSLQSYLFSWYEDIDLVITIYGLSLFFLYLVGNKRFSEMIMMIEERNGNIFVDFMSVAYYQKMLLRLLTVIFIYTTLGLLKIFQFGNQSRALVRGF
jgi:hypothetical protein